MKLQEFKLDLHKRGLNTFETWNPAEHGMEVLLFKFDTDNLRFEKKYLFTEDAYTNNKMMIEYLKQGAVDIERCMTMRHGQDFNDHEHSLKSIDGVNNVCEFCMGKMGSTMPMPNFNSN